MRRREIERALGALEDRELFTLLRRRAGITQDSLAREAGVYQTQVSAYERGRLDEGSLVDRLWATLELMLSGSGSGVAA